LELRVLDPDERSRAAELVARMLAVPVRLASDRAVLSARVGDMDRVAELLGELRRARIRLASFAVGQPSLDEVFLTLTGRPVDDTIPEEEAA
jgi:ABC-2 type transport system ATP-binding protein